MSNRNRKRKPTRTNQKPNPGGDGFITRLFARTKVPAHVSEENDWYLDSPDVRLTRVFAIVLILHVVAVGGILAFKMIEKASGPQEVATRSIAAAESASPVSSKPVAPLPLATTPAVEEAAAPAQEQSEAPPVIVDHPSSKEHLEYRVRASDSLASIARDRKVTIDELRRLNHLDNGDKMYVGKWITIPRNGSPTPVAAETPAVGSRKPALVAATIQAVGEAPAARKPASEATSSKSYVVAAGDTFYGISKKFGVTYQSIMSTNGIDSPQGLRPGMTLQIPAN